MCWFVSGSAVCLPFTYACWTHLAWRWAHHMCFSYLQRKNAQWWNCCTEPSYSISAVSKGWPQHWGAPLLDVIELKWLGGRGYLLWSSSFSTEQGAELNPYGAGAFMSNKLHAEEQPLSQALVRLSSGPSWWKNEQLLFSIILPQSDLEEHKLSQFFFGFKRPDAGICSESRQQMPVNSSEIKCFPKHQCLILMSKVIGTFAATSFSLIVFLKIKSLVFLWFPCF